jgi:hypothetical protein
MVLYAKLWICPLSTLADDVGACAAVLAPLASRDIMPHTAAAA